MRANQRAQAAIGADRRIPDRNLGGDAPLFVLGRARRETCRRRAGRSRAASRPGRRSWPPSPGRRSRRRSRRQRPAAASCPWLSPAPPPRCKTRERLVDRGKILRDDRLAPLPIVLRIASLMCPIASSRGNSPARAKKQLCIAVLIRAPMPASPGYVVTIDDLEPQLLVDDLLLHARAAGGPTPARPDTGC